MDALTQEIFGEVVVTSSVTSYQLIVAMTVSTVLSRNSL